MKTTDVVIVGGGVIGCAIAYALGKKGLLVTLFERGNIGGQASSAAAGLLAPLGPLSGPGPFADLVLTGFTSLVALVPELEENSSISIGYQRTGALRIVRNPKRLTHLQKRFTAWQALGLRLHWLTGEEARRHDPLLTPDIEAAVYAPEEAQLRASQLVHAFAQAARHSVVSIYEQQEIHRVRVESNRVLGVYTVQDEFLPCRYLVLASGAWAAQSATLFNVTLPITPLHGQLLSFPQTSPPLKHIIFGEGAYLVPRGNSILVGATREERGFDPNVTAEATSWLSTTATRLVSALQHSKIETAWAGLRPKTPDSQPVFGFLPGWNNVLIAAGHNSVGIILSAITGIGIAETVVTGKLPPLLQPFSPDRFSDRLFHNLQQDKHQN